MYNTLSWIEFQDIYDELESPEPIRYADRNGNYYLFYFIDDVKEAVCVLDKNDATEFEEQYKPDSIEIF